MSMESRTTGGTTERGSGGPPAEGRDDLALPGGDRDEGLPRDHVPEGEPPPEERRQDDLERRAEPQSPGLPSEGEPDLLPDVEVPRHQM